MTQITRVKIKSITEYMTEIRPNICVISRNATGLNPLINEKDNEVRSQTKLNSMLHLREPHRGKKNSQMFKTKQEAKVHQPNQKKGGMRATVSNQIEIRAKDIRGATERHFTR